MPARTLRRIALLIAAAAFLPIAAFAQTSVSQPVVQAIPGEKGLRLNAALARLARNPQDVEALLDAGKASLELGDVQAAIGFFQRAATLAPGNSRVKAGLAGAHVLSEDPFTAIPLFEEAAKAGPIEPERLADRGLAYDLVGDNATAQTHYRQALAAVHSDETVRRLALSQAIGGDRKGMDATLSPLLQKQDKAAWRTRAFGLAILGQAEEAETIARQTVPPEMAGSIAAYLRYMPKLTPAQQAAAANLGHFPRAAEIGRDDPRVARYARPSAVLASAPVAPATTPPRGARPAASERARTRERVQAPTAQPAKPGPPPPAVPEPRVGRVVDDRPIQVAVAAPPPSPLPAPVPAPVPVPAPPPPAPAPAQLSPASAVQGPPASTGPGFASLDPAKPDGAALRAATQAQQPVAAPAPAPATAPAPAPTAPPPKPRPSLDEAFAEFAPPSRAIEPQSGAVDIRKVRTAAPTAAAKDKAQAEAAKPGTKDAKAPPKPSHPSRIWVQVATGRDKKALAFDWNRMAKADAAVFKSRKGHTAAWGQTSRLLTGPFETEAAAKAFLGQLRKAGVEGAFLWTSRAGEVVDALPGAK